MVTFDVRVSISVLKWQTEIKGYFLLAGWFLRLSFSLSLVTKGHLIMGMRRFQASFAPRRLLGLLFSLSLLFALDYHLSLSNIYAS